MKKFSILLSFSALMLALVFITSCKKDEPDPTPEVIKPVLGTNFNFSVTDNKVNFTTTLMGNVWWTSNGTDYQAVDQKAEVAFAEAGTYSFTCSTLSGGQTVTSDAFDVVVAVGDPSIFNTAWWINLTGGYGKQRGWVLDVEAKLHSGPLTFLGTSWNFATGACNDQTNCWSWDAGLDFTFENDSANVRMDWPGEQGYGTMYFNLINGKKYIGDKKKEPYEEGTFDMNWETRTISITGATILRSYKPFAVVEGVTGRVNGIKGISDWTNYRIYALTDSVLRVAVLRDQDVHGEGEAYLVYNFVEAELYSSIVVAPPPTYVEPVLTTFTAADLVGTWKYAQVAQDWIGWPVEGTVGGKRLNGWNTREQMAETLAGWGAPDPLAVFNAAAAYEFIFNADGTCTLNGMANTYTVSNGAITFGTDLTSEFSLVWIGLSGKNVSVLDVRFDIDGNPYTSDGIWIGQQNPGKFESAAVQLIKLN
jgi:hypothetical protein